METLSQDFRTLNMPLFMCLRVLQVCHFKYILEKMAPFPWSLALSLHSLLHSVEVEELTCWYLFEAKNESWRLSLLPGVPWNGWMSFKELGSKRTSEQFLQGTEHSGDQG